MRIANSGPLASLVALVGWTLVVLVVLSPRSAIADPKLDARWKQSALREDFTVQEWLDARCGPPPQSTSSGGGESIEVRLEGDDLAFVGGGRVYRTNQCYDPMPTLSRETHSRDPNGKTWRTRCATAPADPRKVVLNTLVVATTDTRIDIVETGRYEIVVENGRCMADVKRTRSYSVVQDESTPATPSAAPTPKPRPTEPETPSPGVCATPGDPTKLEVRPSKKLLRPGESFRFRAVVLDARGCETRTATTWKLATPSAPATKGVTIEPSGRVTVTNDAAEGNTELVATAAGKDVRVVVEVASAARYDELLARSGLNAAGENDEASTVTIATESIGAGTSRVEDRSRERRFVFLAIVGGALLVLGIVTAALVRRTRKAKEIVREVEERHEARVQEVLDRRRQREAEHAAQQRAHEESMAAAQAAAEAARRKAADAADPAVRGSREAGQKPRGKICPTCGERYDGNADFCGKDGTILVLLN